MSTPRSLTRDDNIGIAREQTIHLMSCGRRVTTGRASAARLDFRVLHIACKVVRFPASLDPPLEWATT